ncbi:helix-turn-helix domain-containing protein [Pseudomaricurvus alkylphenolicus]|jgi:AraC family transcriptional activator of pobA|uniref:helix-turn-helix domain-containing protein n=1 Tax=Pseudomaricurvus alkylphenolicus TaxID=1306991 RepID=UPI0014201D0F|nr:helix-turn-helix domain-containing protein [Pseudomaricurvus alkylphenolicus]NIB38493.1 helix-turn-helix domain-containing protein [Pseudomaricurvus alkylphenolicus]
MKHIPHYQLYGDEGDGSELNFVHCEPMFNRIEQQNWEISPHRHDNLHQVFWLRAGQVEAQLETENILLCSPSVTLVPAGKVHGFAYEPSAAGSIVTVSAAMMQRVISLSPRWPTKLLDQVHYLELKEESADIVQYLQRVEEESRNKRVGRVAAVTAWICLFFVELGRLRQLRPEQVPEGKEYLHLFEQFRLRVNESLTQHLPVSEYCSRLGVGERRLYRACRTIADVSPSRYIQDALIQEAKRLLIYTMMPATMVCYELGFTDPAYFSRFFKKHTGLSPGEFAKRHREGNTPVKD